MKKHLTANKAENGWHVTVTVSYAAQNLTDVFNIIRYEGLQQKEHRKPTDDNPNETIYAE